MMAAAICISAGCRAGSFRRMSAASTIPTAPLAIRAAKEKADALTSELGVRRGEAQTISESYSGGWWRSGAGWGGRNGQLMQNVVQNAGGASGDDGATLAVGQISVNASVDVTFAIE